MSGCPPCQKVILNGGIAARVLDETCSSIYSFLEGGGELTDPIKLVKMANEIEDLAFKFSKEVLKQQGFEGPWPHSMS